MRRSEKRLSPKVFLYNGGASTERVIEAMESFIDWEAFLFACDTPDPVDSLLEQDLRQEAWLFAIRLLQRDPDIWARKLERLTYLSIKSALKRGCSVFRSDPGERIRHYQRVPLEQATVNNVCTRSLPFDQEHQLLVKALCWAQNGDDREAEHQAILLLRRLARRYQRDDLLLQYNMALREWWRQTRAITL